jgi:hypothetical protein
MKTDKSLLYVFPFVLVIIFILLSDNTCKQVSSIY